MSDTGFKSRARRLLAAWAALIALMLASLASAYVPLGWGNFAAGMAIAVAKAGIVVLLFMGLGRAGALLRLVAALALATWAIQLALSGVDYATRAAQPAAYQQPVR